MSKRAQQQNAFEQRMIKSGAYATEPDTAKAADRSTSCPTCAKPMRLEKISFTRTCATWGLYCEACKTARVPIQIRSTA